MEFFHNQINILIIISFLLMPLNSIQSIQGTDVITPNMDTFVNQDEPNISHGLLDNLTMGKNGSSLYYILLFYDISSYVGISDAVLGLDRANPFQPVTFNIDIGTSIWDESVTWLNKPTDTNSPIMTLICADNDPSCSIDVTDIFIDWQSGTTNYGIILRDTSANYLANFSSREASVSIDPLTMTITYTAIEEFYSPILVFLLIPLIIIIAEKKKIK